MQKIRSYFHKLFLSRKIKAHSHPHENVSMQEAVNIGILYYAGNEQEIQSVKDYTKLLRSNGKKVSLLGYIEKVGKGQKLNFAHFTSQDLNWYLRPTGKKVNDFIKKDWDILINAHQGDCSPLEYITSFSKARFRVGNFHDKKTHCYDLMIQMKKGDNHNDYLDQIDHFLNMIKKAV